MPTRDDIGPVVTMRCCRDWPIAIAAPIGRCGYCGQRPEPIREEESNEPND